MTCSSCGAENRAGRKFCASCGAPLAMACPACGAANEPDDRFCGDCGSALAALGPPHRRPRRDPRRLAAPPSERRLVSVLFTDLVGFTPLSESRDAEEVRELLSGYFDEARRIVDRYGGTIEKFIGDAVMAVWGSPVAREDDAERAVRAGLELVAAVAAIGADEGVAGSRRGRRRHRRGGGRPRRRGRGDGDRRPRQHRRAGPVRGRAGHGASSPTRRQARQRRRVAYDDAGTTTSRARPSRAAVPRRSGSSPAEAARSARPGWRRPSSGATGSSACSRTSSTRPPRVAPRTSCRSPGIGGIGKSRLAWEFEKYLDGLVETSGGTAGRCLALRRRRRVLGARGDGAQPPGRRRGGGARHDAGEAPRLARRVLRRGRGASLARGAARPTPRRSAIARRRRARSSSRAWRRFFELLADAGPVALVFEDLQWADSGLLDFIDELLERGADRPLYVVALARPEIAERRPGWGAGRTGWTSITLQPLADEEIAQMLRGMVPGIPEDLVARIGERAEGIPLYAVETVRMLLDRGVVRRTAEGVELGARREASVDLDIPETLQALIGARLDGLPDDERALLQHASVLGKTFPLSDARRAHRQLGRRSAARSSIDLVRREMLAAIDDAPDRGQFGFLQSIVQRVIYDTLSRRDRKARHLARGAPPGGDLGRRRGRHRGGGGRPLRRGLRGGADRPRRLRDPRRGLCRAGACGPPRSVPRRLGRGRRLLRPRGRPTPTTMLNACDWPNRRGSRCGCRATRSRRSSDWTA